MLLRFFRRSLSPGQWMILGVIAFLIILGAGYVGRMTANHTTQTELEQWEAQITEARARQEFLKKQLAYAQTDDYIDQQARTVMGWARAGDVSIDVIPRAVAPVALERLEPRQRMKLPWQEWWEMFFGS